MRTFISVALLIPFLNSSLRAQSLTLEYCYEKAIQTSPINKQKLQQETVEKLSHKNLAATYMPHFNFFGQASYQNTVGAYSNPF